MKFSNTTHPSLLAVPKLEWDLFFQEIIKLGINDLHFDVMEYDYVKNNAFDVDDLNDIPSNFRNWVHIMACNLDKFLPGFVNNPKVHSIVFQYEPFKKEYIIEKIKDIKKHNKLAGIAIKPSSNFQDYYQLLDHCDHIVIMGVEPGFGGQKLVLESLANLEEISNYIKENKLNITIEFDGGINAEWYLKLVDKVDYLVSGTFFYKHIMQGE